MKVLFLDIETAYLELKGWQLYDQNFSLNQIQKDWSVLSWAASWADKKEVIYQDVSKQKNKRDDSKILGGIWKLLDEADVVVHQNGKRFDIPKLNARFIMNGMKPPSPYRQVDTCLLARKNFGFTSNKLEYLCDALGVKKKKLKHKMFPGFELWTECMKGNKAAWAEMKLYNIRDVDALKEVYEKLAPWYNPIDRRVSSSTKVEECPSCGSRHLIARGFALTNQGKFQRFKCTSCGHWTQDKGQANNLLSKAKRDKLKSGDNLLRFRKKK